MGFKCKCKGKKAHTSICSKAPTKSSVKEKYKFKGKAQYPCPKDTTSSRDHNVGIIVRTLPKEVSDETIAIVREVVHDIRKRKRHEHIARMFTDYMFEVCRQPIDVVGMERLDKTALMFDYDSLHETVLELMEYRMVDMFG